MREDVRIGGDGGRRVRGKGTVHILAIDGLLEKTSCGGAKFTCLYNYAESIN